MSVYHFFFNTVFRRMDPEVAHEVAFTGIKLAAKVPGLREGLESALTAPASGAVRVFDREVPAPFGLAAGFDKDARGVRGLTMLGFGFIEVGTITAQAQPGNDKPRSWRHQELRALRNRMGFNNSGAAAAAKELRKLRARWGRSVFVGVNIGKTKVVSAEDAPQDYAISAALLAPYADYLVVNVSSPNTPGLRDLQAVDQLRPILVAVRKAADEATTGAGGSEADGRRTRVPLLVKIAPDLADEQVLEVADLVKELGLDGVVAVNTTINHDFGPGGLSGPPELERGIAVVQILRERLGEEAVIMGVGGITTVEDARRYLAAGANLLQGFTGFIYEGPFWASRLNKALARGK